MAMIDACHVPIGEPPAPVAAVPFDADRLVDGIVFHVLEEGRALEVDPNSIGIVKRQLKNAGWRSSCARSTWEMLDNAQRLHWLMEQGKVALSEHDGVVTLYQGQNARHK